MKQRWTPQELADHWLLTDTELTLANKYRTDANKLGWALLCKYFQREGRFPRRRQDIPKTIVEHVAQQLPVRAGLLQQYELGGRAAKRHHVEIRALLGIRTGSVADAKAVATWLQTETQLLDGHNADRLKEVVYDRYRELKL